MSSSKTWLRTACRRVGGHQIYGHRYPGSATQLCARVRFTSLYTDQLRMMAVRSVVVACLLSLAGASIFLKSGQVRIGCVRGVSDQGVLSSCNC